MACLQEERDEDGKFPFQEQIKNALFPGRVETCGSTWTLLLLEWCLRKMF